MAEKFHTIKFHSASNETKMKNADLVAVLDAILLESGGTLLLEDAGNILLEQQ